MLSVLDGEDTFLCWPAVPVLASGVLFDYRQTELCKRHPSAAATVTGGGRAGAAALARRADLEEQRAELEPLAQKQHALSDLVFRTSRFALNHRDIHVQGFWCSRFHTRHSWPSRRDARLRAAALRIRAAQDRTRDDGTTP